MFFYNEISIYITYLQIYTKHVQYIQHINNLYKIFLQNCFILQYSQIFFYYNIHIIVISYTIYNIYNIFTIIYKNIININNNI